MRGLFSFISRHRCGTGNSWAEHETARTNQLRNAIARTYAETPPTLQDELLEFCTLRALGKGLILRHVNVQLRTDVSNWVSFGFLRPDDRIHIPRLSFRETKTHKRHEAFSSQGRRSCFPWKSSLTRTGPLKKVDKFMLSLKVPVSFGRLGPAVGVSRGSHMEPEPSGEATGDAELCQ